jgi:3-hydroxybutyryl-CoA dehydrogenase
MGAGIAQLAVQSGFLTTLYDPAADALQRARSLIAEGLNRVAKRGIIDRAALAPLLASCRLESRLGIIADADFVIEAAPEVLDLKLELFGTVDALVGDKCVLATNTSSFSVTELGAATKRPDRVVGMHFFNPAPVMRLVELVAGDLSSERALRTGREVGLAMGKHVIAAPDIAGFVVNRCNRPFSLEALRLLEQRIATVEQIDRIVRLQGGFRMGPFELMDLVGIETNHAVAESMYRQSYGEPRYRPSPLAARKVAAGTLGRKSGEGWYSYEQGQDIIPDIVPIASGRGDDRVLVVAGELPVARELRGAAIEAGFDVFSSLAAAPAAPWLIVDFDTGATPVHAEPRAVSLHHGSLHLIDPRAAGFHLVPPLDHVHLVEVTTTPQTDPHALQALQELAETLGWRAELVADGPGLVLGRIIVQLINEAAFLLQERNATRADIDAAMTLGVNHPHGPIEWCSRIGTDHVLGLLDALHRELGEGRYRAATLLRQEHALAALEAT